MSHPRAADCILRCAAWHTGQMARRGAPSAKAQPRTPANAATSTHSWDASPLTAALKSRIGGRRARVEGGIPTETVRLALSGQRDRPQASVIQVLAAAPERVTPRCPVVDACGGCEWQHLSQAGQLMHKAAIIRRLLAAQRLPTRIDAIHPMPDPWGYRIRAQIALGAEAGFRMRRAKQIIGLRACAVAHPSITRLLEDLNRLLRLRVLPDFRGRALLHAQVVGSPATPQLQLLLEGVDGLIFAVDATTRAAADALFALRDVASVGVVTGAGEVDTLAGPDVCWLTLRGRDLALPAGSFFQSNWSLLPTLLERVLELADIQPGMQAADIYGGVGVFGSWHGGRRRAGDKSSRSTRARWPPRARAPRPGAWAQSRSRSSPRRPKRPSPLSRAWNWLSLTRHAPDSTSAR